MAPLATRTAETRREGQDGAEMAPWYQPKPRPWRPPGARDATSVRSGLSVRAATTPKLRKTAQACGVVANGGMLVRPKILLKKGGEPFQAEPPRRVVRPETAITMRQMMESVVVFPGGTGHRYARLDGYTSGGKTGTAVIYDYETKRYTHTYNGTFMGFAPVPNPAIVVVVTLNGTHGTAGYGGPASAPVFKVVAQEALRVLDVPKDLPEGAAPAEPAGPPEEVSDLAIADLAEPPEPGEDEETEPVQTGPKVPNFRGMTMRAVLAEAGALGLPVQVDGSGVARAQQPSPGTPLHAGERIRVQFAR